MAGLWFYLVIDARIKIIIIVVYVRFVDVREVRLEAWVEDGDELVVAVGPAIEFSNSICLLSILHIDTETTVSHEDGSAIA